MKSRVLRKRRCHILPNLLFNHPSHNVPKSQKKFRVTIPNTQQSPMGSCSYESMSQISERIFQENQYPQPQFSTNQQTPSGSLNSRSKTIKNAFKKKKNQVFLEGYVEATDEDDLVRAKSLTDEDLDELKGCFDLGFGFSYDEIPELCNTLPALELCYSMSQKFLDDQKSPEMSPAAEVAEEMVSPPPAPIASWKISSPGDHPEEVKARLKYWAQAVACTVKLCN